MVDDDADVGWDVVGLNDEEWFEAKLKTLHVVDIQSGDILQRKRFMLQGTVSTLLVDGDEIYIASLHADKIIVLPFAGSEA